MENPIKMDDLGGPPLFFGNTHISYIKRGGGFDPKSSELFQVGHLYLEAVVEWVGGPSVRGGSFFSSLNYKVDPLPVIRCYN